MAACESRAQAGGGVGKGVIYTAITGGKDELRSPQHVVPGVHYICFTDDPNIRSDVWEIRPLGGECRDPVRAAKAPKLLPHIFLPNFEWSLWIDAHIVIVGDLRPFIEEHLSCGSFLAFRLAERASAYELARACIVHEKACPRVLEAQAKEYRSLGMPDDLPAASCGVLLRRHLEPSVMATMDFWWAEVGRHSRRDQVSLPFALWQRPTDFQFFFDGRPMAESASELLRLERHRIEVVFPCWAASTFPVSVVSYLKCWRCRGRRPPIRYWRARYDGD